MIDSHTFHKNPPQIKKTFYNRRCKMYTIIPVIRIISTQHPPISRRILCTSLWQVSWLCINKPSFLPIYIHRGDNQRSLRVTVAGPRWIYTNVPFRLFSKARERESLSSERCSTDY